MDFSIESLHQINVIINIQHIEYETTTNQTKMIERPKERQKKTKSFFFLDNYLQKRFFSRFYNTILHI